MRRRERQFRECGGPVEARRAFAFTLVELLISLVLVVMLLAGVNEIFRASSDTVGIGQAVNTLTRDARAAEAVMQYDGRAWAPDAPMCFIRCMMVNTATGPARRDYMAFPARGTYRRQTADDNSFVSGTASREAWVWYGHLADTSGALTGYLGRFALLLRDSTTINEAHITATTSLALSPIAGNSSASAGGWLLRQSRYDLGAATIETLRARVTAASATANWWTPVTDFRFTCNPRPARPLTSAGVAQAAPVLIEGVSEFIIEYAGDFLVQETTQDLDGDGQVTPGKVVALGQDGRTDFFIHPLTGLVTTRWYGFPRDTSSTAAQFNGGPDGAIVRASGQMDPNQLVDVVPLADVIVAANLGGAVPAWHFERDLSGAMYTCVWVNQAPQMVRVTMTVEDPAGRLADGMRFEFVIGPR